MASELKFRATHVKYSILTPKQMSRRLPIALPQVKAVNTSENC